MIKAILNTNGKKTALFGLSDINVEKLKNNEPIFIDGEKLNMNMDVIIMHGQTEGDVYRQLKKAGLDLPVPKIEPGHAIKFRNGKTEQ